MLAGSRKVTFAYDYQGRRVAKRVYNWSGGQWVLDPLEERRFVWHDWLMLEELSGGGTGAPAENAPLRQYTWGLDLAGLSGSVNSLQAAGGIGGLLAVHQAALDRPGEDNDVAAGDFAFAYDGNGNVVQVLDLKVADWQDPVPQDDFEWHGSRLAARYEYDAYGNVIGPDTNSDGQFDELDAPGHYAAENAMRFSTKYFDRETGLGNWGYRYYSPTLGRWVSRDPLGEAGSANLLAALWNNPLFWIDPDGAQSMPAASQPASQPTSAPVGPRHRRQDPEGPSYDEGIRGLRAGETLLRKACDDCCKTPASNPASQPAGGGGCCNPTCCKREAREIYKALRDAWSRNYGLGPHWGHRDPVAGYYCWDWANIFEDALSAISLQCWSFSRGTAVDWNHGEDYNGDGVLDAYNVHYYVKLFACGSTDNKCRVTFDDGFYVRNQLAHGGQFPAGGGYDEQPAPWTPTNPAPFPPAPRPVTNP